jgi:type II secretory pathway component PulF
MTQRIFYRRQIVTSNTVRMALSLAAWLLIALAVLGASIGLMAMLSLYFLPVAIVSLFMLVDRIRRSEHHALLNSLAFAAEKQVPLPEAARAFAQENAGDTGVRALRLAEGIESGATLAVATHQARLRLATPLRLAVNLSDALLARGLNLRAQVQWGSETDAAFRAILNRLFYLLLVFHLLGMLTTFVMIRITPVYEKMFQEFGLKLPPPTLWIIRLSHLTFSGGWVLLIPGILIGFVGAIVGVGYYTGWYDYPFFWLIYFFFGKLPKESDSWWGRLRIVRYLLRIMAIVLGILTVSLVMAIYVDYLNTPLRGPAKPETMVIVIAAALAAPIGWILIRTFLCTFFPVDNDSPLADEFRLMDLAFVSRMFAWRYDASLVLRSLSLLMKQNMPLPQALILLANVYPRGNVRRRLTNAALDVERGGDWKLALRRQWLLGPAEQALLAAAERAGNLPWALDEMGEGLMRRLTYRLTLVYQFVFPILLLLAASLVGFFCLAMFLPLISMINGLLEGTR